MISNGMFGRSARKPWRRRGPRLDIVIFSPFEALLSCLYFFLGAISTEIYGVSEKRGQWIEPPCTLR